MHRNLHQRRIAEAYSAFVDEPGFSHVVENADALAATGGDLSITRYVTQAKGHEGGESLRLCDAWGDVEAGAQIFWDEMDALTETLNRFVPGGLNRE